MVQCRALVNKAVNFRISVKDKQLLYYPSEPPSVSKEGCLPIELDRQLLVAVWSLLCDVSYCLISVCLLRVKWKHLDWFHFCQRVKIHTTRKFI
jgi:hypothetical protein